MGDHNFQMYRNLTEIVNEILAVLRSELKQAQSEASTRAKQEQQNRERFTRSTEQSQILAQGLKQAQENVDGLVNLGLDGLASRIAQLNQAMQEVLMHAAQHAQQSSDIVQEVRWSLYASGCLIKSNAWRFISHIMRMANLSKRWMLGHLEYWNNFATVAMHWIPSFRVINK